MSNAYKFAALFACTVAIAVIGCKPKPVAEPKAAPKATEGPTLEPPKQTPTTPTQADAGDKEDAAKIKANLASLSTEDRALAEKQKICPVSGEPLGGMGTPKKLHVAGQDVFICCAGCEKEVTSEPEKYLAKVGLKPAK